MYSFFRPILFRLDPEVAHQLTLYALRIGGIEPIHSILRVMYSVPSKPVQAFGLTFKNPVGLAAGYDKDAVAIKGLTALGFGHLEVGTVTPKPQPGNPKPRVFRLLEDEAVINRMGFPSHGSEFVQKQLNPALRKKLQFRITFSNRIDTTKDKVAAIGKGDTILGINLGKNKATPNEEAVLDYLDLLQSFAPYADYLTINISSPNTVGLRQLQGREALSGLLSHLHTQRQLEEAQLNKKIPLLVKLAPDLNDEELEDAVGVILDKGMDGIIATNTTLARAGLSSKQQSESGGLSGSPLGGRSEAVLSRVVKLVNGKVPIVSVGGVMNPDDAKKRLALGASLVQVYTGLIYQGPQLVQQIIRSL